MKIPTTHRDANIWYAYFNTPPKVKGTVRKKSKVFWPRNAVNYDSSPAEEPGTALIREHLLPILSDMRQEEKRHLETLSRVKLLITAPDLEQLLARNLASVHHFITEMEKVVRLTR